MSNLIKQEAFRVIEGRPVTSSRIVAEYFGKQHHHVVRDIRNLIAQKPDLERNANFGECSETVSLANGATRQVPMYWMDRKGFSILAMGFTGAKALDFKCAFYDEFERMEQALRPAPASAPTYITPEQGYLIQSEVQRRVHRDGVNFQTVYHALKARFKVPKYTFIRTKDFDEAIRFIRTCELRVPTQARPTSLPQPISEDCLILSGNDAERIVHFIYYWRYLFRPQLEMILKLLRTVNSPMAARFWEAIHELHLPLLEESLRRQGYDVKGLSCYKHLMENAS